MPRYPDDEKIRELIGSSIAYTTDWKMDGVPVYETLRCGGLVLLRLADNREFKITVERTA